MLNKTIEISVIWHAVIWNFLEQISVEVDTKYDNFHLWKCLWKYCLQNVGHIVLVSMYLTHWGRVKHIWVGKLAIIGSYNGLSPGRRQAIIWTTAGILLIEPLGTNFSQILIGIQIFSFTKMRLKMSSAKWRSFWLGLNALKQPTTPRSCRPVWCLARFTTCSQARSYPVSDEIRLTTISHHIHLNEYKW